MKKSIFILITFIFNSLVIPQDYIKMEFGNGTSSVSDFSMEVQDGSESFEIKVKRLRSNLRGLDFQFEERINDHGYYNEYIKMLLNLASASGDGITIKGKDNEFSVAVSLNAAAGLIVAEKASNFNDAYKQTRNQILSGKVYEHLIQITIVQNIKKEALK